MRFSEQQRRAITWWRRSQKQAVICDGAVRSGKTLALGLGFFLWATACFQGRKFALCGKTAEAVRRNLLEQVGPLMRGMGFFWEEKVSKRTLRVGLGGRVNTFYLFGGKDEGSAALIQGVTLAGALLDEAALMPRSFVEQACARCSVEGARLWFSCNPAGPEHWFYQEWILKREEKECEYLHFTMADNPGLSDAVRQRYETVFQGVFYQRYVLGVWTAAEGLVYDFQEELNWPPAPEDGVERWAVSCDYGTVNPTSMGLWGKRNGVWYRVKEFYYDSRARGRQRTDQEYAEDLERLVGNREVEAVVVDPSAASFMEVLRRRGWPVIRANNDVLDGLRVTAGLLRQGRLVLCESCEAARREMALYRWKDGGKDQVIKQDDHAMDDIRYFAATVAAEEETETFAESVRR